MGIGMGVSWRWGEEQRGDEDLGIDDEPDAVSEGLVLGDLLHGVLLHRLGLLLLG